MDGLKGCVTVNNFDFVAICAYYYTRELVKYSAYAAAALVLLFIIHKLVSWGLWVLSF